MANPTPAQSASARATINAMLASYGMGTAKADDGRTSLGDWAWARFQATGDPQIVVMELRNTKAFAARFPAYNALAKAGRAISPDEYIAYEKAVFGMLQQYGVPDGMYNTSSGIADLLINDVSASEVSERLSMAAQAMYTAPPEVRDYLTKQYQVKPGDMVGYWLDPDKAEPILAAQWTAAQIGGAAQQYKFSLQRSEAESAAAAGFTYEQARAAAERAATMRGLTVGAVAVDDAEDLVTSNLGDAQAQNAVTRVATGRLAQSQAGGTAAAVNEGISGLGRAGRT